MVRVTLTDFRKRMSQVLSDVEKGRIFVLVRHGKAIAALSPVGEESRREPAWKLPGLRLTASGMGLSKAIIEEREGA